jgi:hypothetical protein
VSGPAFVAALVSSHSDAASVDQPLPRSAQRGKAIHKKVDDVWKKPAARIGQVVIKDRKITVGTELD